VDKINFITFYFLCYSLGDLRARSLLIRVLLWVVSGIWDRLWRMVSNSSGVKKYLGKNERCNKKEPPLRPTLEMTGTPLILKALMYR